MLSYYIRSHDFNNSLLIINKQIIKMNSSLMAKQRLSNDLKKLQKLQE